VVQEGVRFDSVPLFLFYDIPVYGRPLLADVSSPAGTRRLDRSAGAEYDNASDSICPSQL
jgi:hypothetical protein